MNIVRYFSVFFIALEGWGYSPMRVSLQITFWSKIRRIRFYLSLEQLDREFLRDFYGVELFSCCERLAISRDSAILSLFSLSDFP